MAHLKGRTKLEPFNAIPHLIRIKTNPTADPFPCPPRNAEFQLKTKAAHGIILRT